MTLCYYCAACSPVLLPSRVVQALNLNVHTLGLQISPRQGSASNIFIRIFFFFFTVFDLSLTSDLIFQIPMLVPKV